MAFQNLKKFIYKILYFKVIRYYAFRITKFNYLKFIKNIFNRDCNSIIKEFLKFLRTINLLKSFSNIFKSCINKRIVCFGSMMGKQFIDNPKYLFLYLNSNSNYKCYWFTSSREVFNELKKKGFSVVYNFSFKAIKILKRAGYIITAWGLTVDFLPISFSKESVIVLTWHGHQFKKIFADIGSPARNPNIYDYLISPSKNINKYLTSAFQIDSSKIIVTGLPRNDMLFHVKEKFKKIIKNRYNISKNFKRIILYAPTFRKQHLIAKFPLSKKDFKDLSNYLRETGTLLICKSHFANKIVLYERSPNIIVIDKFTDIQELIIISDLLITDYSTIFFDFILMQKPVILFPYDLEEYIKFPGLYHKLDEITVGPIAKNGNELIEALKTLPVWIPKSKNRIIEIRNKYWDYHDGKSCERFFDKINLKN